MKAGPQQDLKAFSCPVCEKVLDACSVINEDGSKALPAKGDVSVCAYCGNLMIFDGKSLEPRELTQKEHATVMADPYFHKSMEVIDVFKKRFRH